MKVLIIFPKLEPFKEYHYMPYSALCVAAIMMEEFEVEIYDERVQNRVDLLNKLETTKNTVLITAYTGYQLSSAYEIAKFIKNIYPYKKIVLGGPHATELPDQTGNDPYIDRVYTGYLEKGEHPIPWHLIDIHKYINPATERFIFISSYGCVGRCAFCATKERKGVVFIPMAKVEQDIDNLMAMYPFKECVMFDATVFTKPDRALGISQIMQKHQLSWIADARAVEIAMAENLDEIISTGLKQITIGLESGSPRVIEAMNKGKHHLEHFVTAAQKLSQYNVRMVSGVIFGTPGETVDDLELTIEFIKRIKAINPNFYVSSTFYRPLPGTAMSEMAKEYGYKEPQSLEEWAALGERSHYSYNTFMDSPWIKDIDAYRKVYEEFRGANLDLFV